MTRDDITSSLYGAAFIGNNVMRVVADTMAGLAHGVLRYADWLARQIMPDQAEREWLDRFARMWLKNADGTMGRKQATVAAGSVLVTGAVPGALIPMGSFLTGNSLNYQTTEERVVGELPVDTPVRCTTAGKAGNEPLSLSFSPVLIGVDAPATVVKLQGGADIETDDQLRTRVLLRIRQPPMGGDATDWVQWSLAVTGVTRAWVTPNEMGIGTVTVRFMCDDLRAENNGFPYDEDIQRVTAYLDQVRPVAIKDRFVFGPIPQRIDVVIRDLVPNDDATKAAIESNLLDMLYQQAAPGQTIYSAWKTYAIMNTAEVVSFDLVNDEDDVMLSAGHMAVLGDIEYLPANPGT